ncbi:MAG: glycoside hydrolase family 2 protein [Methylacidiphilales bacterium]|nr:glycoside hydrolase family 2 protein [Candidatus Methylacidiphilales bacterium]
MTIPHTYSGPQGTPTYVNAWYRVHFPAKRDGMGSRTYIYFEGVATIMDVYVNGKHLGQHRGAFTAAIFDATDALADSGDNLLAVRVSNDPQETADCLPSGLTTNAQLYRIYGGIYRKVWLVHTPACHIYPELASSGVFVREDSVDANEAKLTIRTALRDAWFDRTLTVRHRVLDADGNEAARFEQKMTLHRNALDSSKIEGVVPHPKLWGPGSPYLYQVVTELVGDDGMVFDRVTTSVGLRSFKLDPVRGFLLNGEPIFLRGVSKHQETEDKLTAVSDDDLREDWRTLQDLGVNAVRLAHYPHASLEYDLADRAGILVWAENGNSNKSLNTSVGGLITREMVRQNFNHPSIVFWSCGNETHAMEPAGTYAGIIRQEDTSRLITYASIDVLPHNLDFVTHNIYPYWYPDQKQAPDYRGGDPSLKEDYISENGAGSSISTHCAYGQEGRKNGFYEPEEYQELLVERIMPTLFDRNSHVRLYFWWTLREFGDNRYKGRNTKGMITYQNFRKDIFYLFQSYLRPGHLVLHICGKTHFLRIDDSARGIKVYSNAEKLSLMINGRNMGEKSNGAYQHPGGPTVRNVFFWDAELEPGRNDILVSDGEGHHDKAVLYAVRDDEFRTSNSDLVQDLASSNRRSPAYFIADPIRAQEPVYYQCDGNADNTFDQIPPELEGCERIATKRLSDWSTQTTLSFTISPHSLGADVYVLMTGPIHTNVSGLRQDFSSVEQDVLDRFQQSGFTPTSIEGIWRDNYLHLVGCTAMVRHTRAGEQITVPASIHDYVVLVRPKIE